MYFWLCWVCVAAWGLSLVVESEGCSRALMLGLLTAVASLWSSGLRVSRASVAVTRGLSWPRGIQDLLCIGRQTPNPWTIRKVLPSVERSSLVVQETTEIVYRLLGGLARIALFLRLYWS